MWNPPFKWRFYMAMKHEKMLDDSGVLLLRNAIQNVAMEINNKP